jgi:hypothetical protein
MGNYLLNDEYESDLDVPVVKQTQSDARDKMKKVIALSVGMFGLLGNCIVYVLSRFVEVMIPHVTYENGQKMYHWASDLTGHSYPYFVQAYDLEFLIAAFWILFLCGIVIAFFPKEKCKTWWRKRKTLKRCRCENTSDESLSS